MLILKMLGCSLACSFWGGIQESHAAHPKLPDPVKQAVASIRKGDGPAMMRVNKISEVWSRKIHFEPQEVQRALLPMAQAGNPEAMFALGTSMVRYAEPGPGETVPRGKEWIRKAAESGYAPAMLAMVSHSHDNAIEEKNRWIKKAYETLLQQAEAGDVEAMLGLVHVPWLHGGSSDRDRILVSNKEIEMWMRKAMALGSTEALVMVAQGLRQGRIERGRDKLVNRQEAMELSMKLVGMGHWPTMVDLGVIYAEGCWLDSSWEPNAVGPDGEILKRNPAKAWAWWDKAIAIAGEEAVLKYLLDEHNIGTPVGGGGEDCEQIPPRPKKQ